MIMLIAAIAVVVIAIAAVWALTAPGGDENDSNDETESTTVTVTDVLGREVTVPKTIARAGAHGMSMTGLMAMFDGDHWKVADTGLISDAPVSLERHAMDLSKIKGIGSRTYTAEDIEKIVDEKLDVLFVNVMSYSNEKDNMDTLSAQVPIVYVDPKFDANQTFIHDGIMDPDSKKSIEVMGEILNMQSTAKRVVDGISSISAELYNNSGLTEKNTIWVAYSHGGSLTTTYMSGNMFEKIIGTKFAYNATEADKQSSPGSIKLDPEVIGTFPFDTYVFSDGCAGHIEGTESQNLLASLFTNGKTKAYIVPQCAVYSLPWDAAMIVSYMYKAFIYDCYSMDELRQKCMNVMSVMYGDDGPSCFNTVEQISKGLFDAIGYEMPYFAELKIVKDSDGTYSVQKA